MRQTYRKNKNHSLTKRFILLCFLAFLGAFGKLSVGFSADNPSESDTYLVSYLASEKINLTNTLNTNEVIVSPQNYNDLKKLQAQNQGTLELFRVKINNFNDFLINQHNEQKNLTQRLKKLQQVPLLGQPDEDSIQSEISQLKKKIEINKQAMDLIGDNLSLAHQFQQQLLAQNKALHLWEMEHGTDQQLIDLDDQAARLGIERDALYQKNIALQTRYQQEGEGSPSLAQQTALLLNNQSIILLQYQISVLELEKKRIKTDFALNKQPNLKSLQSTKKTYESIVSQLITIQQSIEKMIALLNQQSPLLTEPDLKKQALAIEHSATSYHAFLKKRIKKIERASLAKQQQLGKQLSLDQGFVEYRLESWSSILTQLTQLPAKFYKYVHALTYKIKENYTLQPFWPSMFYWATLSCVFIVAFVLHRFLRFVDGQKQRSRLSAHLYDGILVLLYRNIPHLTLLAVLLVTFWFNHLAFPSYRLLVDLMLLWLTFRNFILVVRLILLESTTDVSGYDAKLYYQLRLLLLFGGWSAAFMVLSHQLPMSPFLQDLFNRLFMLFLLAVSWIMWKTKDVFPHLLRPLLKARKRYFRHVTSLFIIIVPLILFTTAIIGVIGYTSLAWTLSRYQAYLLLLLVSYVLLRGLLFDALELFSEWMVIHLHNGWLWIEVVLKPLDKMIRLALFLASVFTILQLFGWYSDPALKAKFYQIIEYPFVNVSGIYITLKSTIEFVLLLCIFIWASKWTREFCYRWVYRRTKDVGIRNSLSVFTQYAIILIGAFITLRVLGLDFSGMAMILGGFAVGMGFGLRDFASNIVGGLMLLIERPVREGDLITIGEHEGRVAHIGIRSMRVSSWDNMEVLIPNAETFNKPFTNWTHQDSIVRTVIPIKVSRVDDPVQVRQLIVDVLEIVPEILSDPEPQVFMKQIDEALIEFEVRYFINVQLHTRFEIRSKVLFAITAQFKAAGIRPPIPPYRVEWEAKEEKTQWSFKSESDND